MDDVTFGLPAWGQGIMPDPARPLHGSPFLELTPLNFIAPSGPKPVLFESWDALGEAFTTWDGLEAAAASWSAVMQGHPGYDGGAPSLPAGTGVAFGVTTYDGAEWWPTQVEGLLGSAPWEATMIRPATQDGEWLQSVGSGGRTITIEGTVLAPDRAVLERAFRQAAACFATPPRTGWLRYRDIFDQQWRMPVVLTEPVRVKPVGDCAFDVQITVKGVDVGTAGAGVHFESENPQTPVNLLPWGDQIPVVLAGYVPSWPVVTVRGPVDAGAVVTFPPTGDGVPVTLKVLPAVTSGQTLRIDCRRRRVVLERIGASDPLRGAVEVNRWPVLPIGPSTVTATGSGAGHITINLTDLM